MLTEVMNVFELTSNQLKRAATIKGQIEDLNKELAALLGAQGNSRAAPRRTGGTFSKKVVAARPATLSGKPGPRAKKKTFSAATRAKLSAKLKAYWAAKRAGRK
jgi:hypothetical protein